MRVVIAMSGGVDSSTVAAMLQADGYDCIGVTMQTYKGARTDGGRAHGCCTIDEVRDAQKVAHQLGIPHYLLNYEKVFNQHVIDNFLDEYVAGRTPNPCVRCNQFIKFDVLREFAGRMGAEKVASGHYARIGWDGARWHLYKGRDPRKDQSYVLYVMTQEQLAHTLFPLADLTDRRTREKARGLGLHLADKWESYEVCFVPDGNYLRFITERRPEAAQVGPIRHMDGRVLGEHRGIAFYTVGQRRGLGIANADALYVVRIDRPANTLWVGEADHLQRARFRAHTVHWIPYDAPPGGELHVHARIRYNAPETPAVVYPQPDGTLEVELRAAQRAVAPGQSVVFYDEDEVLGGAIIG